MDKMIHRADTRGFADHGWLKANHYFSFAGYFNPDRMGFGTLRVINDDSIAPAKGFGTHPHDNMEIITIPLEGELAHQDSTGNGAVIYPGEVQVMSAGTGIWHSEFNHSDTETTKLFQIWIIPNKNGHEPRYAQKKFLAEDRLNKFQLIVSPEKNGNALWINQNAFVSRIDMNAGLEINYKKYDDSNGVYFLLIDGYLKIDDFELKTRDAAGFVKVNDLKLKADSNSQLLILEVPMK